MKYTDEQKQEAQDDLMEAIADTAEEYLDGTRVKELGLDEDAQSDIFIGAVLTLFANHMAFVAAHEDQVDFTPHLEDSFEAVRTLFTRLRKRFLKDLGKKDLEPKEATSSSQKKDKTLH